MSRGDQREDIFLCDVDRYDFLKTLAEACRKTGWQVHAFCLMRNHFHLVLETPNGNLVDGMRWFLSKLWWWTAAATVICGVLKPGEWLLAYPWQPGLVSGGGEQAIKHSDN